MDLELNDEQTWLSESLTTLLEREWPRAEAAHTAGRPERDRLWTALVDFGVLAVDPEEGLGAIELCLAARAFGTHLASTPFLGSAALRFAAADAFDDLGDARVSVALLEPDNGWSLASVLTSARPVDGRKVAVEHADEVDRFAVVATAEGAPALALVATDAAGVAHEPQASLDVGVPLHAVTFSGVEAEVVLDGDQAGVVLARLSAIGALLAAAESVGAAGRMLEDARAYAAQRRQFGRTIGSNQALRHILADMYVRQASAWSTVLYAAAALDDDLSDAARTAAVAKAYVARAAREVAHGAIQVFGGVAFTEEHQAHRFLRRIVVREQQFGDAAHHERELGRTLAAMAPRRDDSPVPTPVS
jgi:alkylation response protein AidB-like acyl-CoA dehydrogenase